MARALHLEKASFFVTNLVTYDSHIHGISQRESRCVRKTIRLNRSFPPICSTVSLGLHCAPQLLSPDGSGKARAPLPVVSAGTTNPHRGHHLPQPIAAGFKARCYAWQAINSILKSPEPVTSYLKYHPSPKISRASQPHIALYYTPALPWHLIRYRASISPSWLHTEKINCATRKGCRSHTNSVSTWHCSWIPEVPTKSSKFRPGWWMALDTTTHTEATALFSLLGSLLVSGGQEKLWPDGINHRRGASPPLCMDEGNDSGYDPQSTHMA